MLISGCASRGGGTIKIWERRIQFFIEIKALETRLLKPHVSSIKILFSFMSYGGC
jgi:hypothetical protein